MTLEIIFRCQFFYIIKMEIITSLSNNLIKKASSLQDKKYRDEMGLFLIEGYRNEKDCINLMQIENVILSQSAYEKFGEEFANCVVAQDKVFEKIATTSSCQGVVAIAKII